MQTPLPKGISVKRPLGFLYSQKSLEAHYRHHAALVRKLNLLVNDTKFENLSVDALIRETVRDHKDILTFNIAAEVYNHNFFWRMLSTKKQEPSEDLERRFEIFFGGFKKIKNFGCRSCSCSDR